MAGVRKASGVSETSEIEGPLSEQPAKIAQCELSAVNPELGRYVSFLDTKPVHWIEYRTRYFDFWK